MNKPNIFCLIHKLKTIYRYIVTSTYYKIFVKYIGEGTVIFKPNLITGLNYLSIGNNCMIYENCRIQILDKYLNEVYNPVFTIGNETQIHQNCHITCAGIIHIGDNVIIVSNVTITDIIHPYIDINMPINKQKLEVGSVIIGDQTYIYNNSVILPNVKIGKHCVIGANSLVNKDIPDYCIAVGNPAKVIRQYDHEKSKWINI